ncbi:type-4 uracil-DNA glycosylase [Thermofilum pendens]|uniref:Type-4 uracil-DNA glycosylase n=1 Tax=Thermofilum pendens (strain DSM 2475 / Hrk 5) TaxID=368408 RepID=A1RYC0_THEPD|nr:type-4 uracil-DNA glycosylase [Thermofilum pendens]ABL78200.1 phage SPO1 DNA polymerase-related protein [Thermofilum pendens Hrk 5]
MSGKKPAGSNASCGDVLRALEEIAGEIAKCEKCPLSRSRTHTVPGEGNPCSGVVFIGEAPGRNEDLQGRPFVGAAGALLTELISLAGLSREEVFITNVVKCRPPNNREPREEEIAACLPYLLAQLRAIKPRLIVTLGKHSTKTILRMRGMSVDSIMSVRGKAYTVNAEWGQVTVFPTLHPAAALYNPAMRKVLEEDFRFLRGLLEGGGQRTLDSWLG